MIFSTKMYVMFTKSINYLHFQSYFVNEKLYLKTHLLNVVILLIVLGKLISVTNMEGQSLFLIIRILSQVLQNLLF